MEKNEENFFIANKNLFLIFIVGVLFYIVFASISGRGIFFDAPAMFSSVLNFEEHGDFYVFFQEARTRNFSNILLMLPYNFITPFFPDKLMTKLNLFVFSYYFSTFLAFILNYFIAGRTKRYDIAIWSFAFYALFYLPSSVWFVKELHLALMLQFILLQYFLTSQKLKRFDYVIVSFLLLFFFESYENALFIAPLFILSSIFFFIKKTENFKIKTIIGIFSILAFCYVLFKTCYSISTNIAMISFTAAFNEYSLATVRSFQTLFSGSFVISLFGIFYSIYIYFVNRKFSKIDLMVAVFFMIISCSILFHYTKFIPTPNFELVYYVLPLIFSVPLFLYLIIKEMCFKSLSKNIFYNNLFIITCIIGCINLLWQINACRYSQQYYDFFKYKVDNSKEKIIRFNEDDKKQPLFRSDMVFGTLIRSIFVSEKFYKDKIVVPDNNIPNEFSYYDEKDNVVVLQNVRINVKSKYWDLTNLIPVINKYESDEKNKNNTGK